MKKFLFLSLIIFLQIKFIIPNKNDFQLKCENKLVFQSADLSLLNCMVGKEATQNILNKDWDELRKGKLIEAAVIFCDICSFTETSEKIGSKNVLALLNSYFNEMVEIVNKHKGIVNKFLGDGLMIVFEFDEKQSKEEFMNNIIQCAIQMCEIATIVKIPDGKSVLNRCGINFGKVIAGVVGSVDRFEYSYVGDAVNIASRLEGLAKDLKHRILISKSICDFLSVDLKNKFTDLGMHQLRGKKVDVHLFGMNLANSA
ncbi:TPA: hypothetical protein DEO28_02275 [Candidatus Dependentiae bacterium]|nr:MAG: Adenylate/guanylate cyclase with integral membrane sensor [candidate division TM6 bacterium GW2011_GWE2_31_21]KKP53220.1 MAG: Adenylate/guanylate cyclase with integral membrane sensor [candidate division TM6 bacterium GW2011_GWF2_33_332]HBS48081.1 hypothetical protein [Candidatus Dependentiae bacterium]HBZ73316.1 hypothetical protein [Candidatus Dependentiae bacterium]